MTDNNITVSILGLGYVGLPVAVAFGKIRHTIGFDINKKRIDELKAGYRDIVQRPLDSVALL